jgi:hypothetical protein
MPSANSLSLNNVAFLSLNAPVFVGPLDALVAQGATFLYAASSQRLLTSYTGNACRLQGNGTGSPEAEIGYLPNGDIDLAAVAAIAAQDGGTEAFGVTWYDQLGVRNATQVSAANRMPFSTALNAKGGWGNGVAMQKWFNLNLGEVPFPFYVSAVVKTVTSVSSRHILGTSNGLTNRLMRTSNGAMQQNFGLTLAGTPLEVSDGLHVLGFLANGASSKHFRDGTLLTTGDAGNSQNSMLSGRIGAASSASTSYLNTAGNAIMEMVIFSMDPTSLAGWNDFQANQLARYS